MSRGEIIKFLILRSVGNFLLLFALYGVVMTVGPALFFEVQYRIVQARGIHYRVAEVVPTQPTTTPFGEILKQERGTGEPQTSGFAQVLSGPKEQVITPPDPAFSIIIPKIGAAAKVFPNVDASNEKQFLPILQKGVAHTKGTVFPGIRGNIYLFAHSTDNFWDVGRYNAVFYLLKELTAGDDVIVYFENTRHNYRVSQTKIIDPSDVSYITQSHQSAQETLILQTCWPPGTTWKRLLVFANPK